MTLSEVPWQVVSEPTALKGDAAVEILKDSIKRIQKSYPEHDKVPLLQLVHDDNTCGKSCRCFESVTLESIIAVPPAYQKTIELGVLNCLLQNVARYLPELGGIWVTHSKVTILARAGEICVPDPLCHILLPVRVTVLLLHPTQGSTLTGKVQYVDKGGVTCTTHGLATAHIPRSKLPQGWFGVDRGIIAWGGFDGHTLGYPTIQMGHLMKFHVAGLKITCGNTVCLLEGAVDSTGKTGRVGEDGKIVPLPDISDEAATAEAAQKIRRAQEEGAAAGEDANMGEGGDESKKAKRITFDSDDEAEEDDEAAPAAPAAAAGKSTTFESSSEDDSSSDDSSSDDSSSDEDSD